MCHGEGAYSGGGDGSGEASCRRLQHGEESARTGNAATGVLRGSRGAAGPVGTVGRGWEGRGAAQTPAAQGCCHVVSRAGPLERGSEGLQARWRRLWGGGCCAPAAARCSDVWETSSKLVPSLGGCRLHRRLVVVPPQLPRASVHLHSLLILIWDIPWKFLPMLPLSEGGLQLVLSPACWSPSGPAPPSAAQLP